MGNKEAEKLGNEGDMMLKRDVVSCIGFWDRKRILIEKLVTSDYSLSFS